MRGMSAALCALLLEACSPGAFDDLVVDHGKATAEDAASEAPEDASNKDAGSLPGRDAGANGIDATRPEDASKVAPANASGSDTGPTQLDAEMNPPPDAAQDAGDASCGDLANDPNNCGYCGMRCAPPESGYATCRMGSCYGVVFVRGAAEAINFVGGDGGTPFSNQLCPPNDVLIGVQVQALPDVAYGMAVRCGWPQLRAKDAGVPAVDIADDYGATPIGVGLSDMAAATTYDLRCDPGEVVTEVHLTSWRYWDYRTIKDIGIGCSMLNVTAQRKIELTESWPHYTDVDISTGNDVEPISTTCPDGEVVVGFTGNSGAHIDGLRTNCAKLSVREATADGTLAAE